MTRLRRRPNPPAATTPTRKACKPRQRSSAGTPKQQQTTGASRPGSAVTPRSGPVDRIRPNLFISPVIGRARTRTTKKSESTKRAVQSTVPGGSEMPKNTQTENTQETNVARRHARSPISSKKTANQTLVSDKRTAESVVKSSKVSEYSASGEAGSKKVRGTAAAKATTLVAPTSKAKTPSPAGVKREGGTTAAQLNKKSVAKPVEKTPRRTQTSKAKAAETAAPSAQPSAPSGKTPGRTRTKKESASDGARPRAVPASKKPSRGKTTAIQAAAGQSVDQSKVGTRKPVVTGSHAKSFLTVVQHQVKTVLAADDGRTGTESNSTNNQADAASKPAAKHNNTVSMTSDGNTKPARPSKPTGGPVASPVKRPRADGPPSSSRFPSTSPVAAAAAETPLKRQRVSAASPKSVTFRQEEEEVVVSPSRFTAILPRPPLLSRPPASSTSAPLSVTAPVSELLTVVATPRRHRLPRHVTSTPCGPPAPPSPVANTAETCYGFLEDVEAENPEETAPLEQVVSPVGVSRARPPPLPPHRLKDATNLPSRFNVGRLVRKPAGARSEVTTTVASQLMDPEVTFSKPASRSYSRRRNPSASGGHSTLGHSTLGSETSTAAGDVTRTKQRRQHKKERDEQMEAEMDRWAALVNSRLSEVDSFELVVERS